MSVNGDTGPAVVLGASDVGALPISGGSMTGNIDMGANNLLNASSVASTGNVSGAAMTAGTFNGVALTTGGVGGLYLADDGNYTTPADSDSIALQYSDTGNRAPGTALRSGGDLFGNLTPGSGIGQPTTGGVVREIGWRRTTTPLGSIRVSAINVAGGTERAFILVATPAAVGSGLATGLNFAVNDGEQVAAFWDSSSSSTVQDLAVTVLVSPS